MLTRIVKFKVKADQVDVFQSVMLAHRELAIKEAGCQEYRLFVDNEQPSIFFIYQRWLDKPAEALHAQQDYTLSVSETVKASVEEKPEVFDLQDTFPQPVAMKPALRSDQPFVIFFIFKIEQAHRAALLEQFEQHIVQTREEAGCRLFDLYTVDGDESTLAVYEHWRNESAVWDIHFSQPYSKVTGALMESAVIGDMKQYMNFVTEL
ncbi:putative quinol monooxygenase [Shewanella gelidii]|uniref:ABM domain-containing protein n=1 Tax=Shewanella gelidii TaxID=1642821 RepID=A0A917JJI9_9GAMM|nr:antibiotic biosynthesis monooxygenase [Shewanella gelidii]MCL1096951.1 antibiotic biosynthesis monooxygenase [Shewanella gelidii]GGI71463.1 hypothetical protein GCM10009332_05970 [Shewanella gelidii]